MSDMEQSYVNTRQAAVYLGLSTSTLNRYRVGGEGPAFHRFGSRVLYHRDDLDAWAGERRLRSTSDTAGGARETAWSSRGRVRWQSEENLPAP